MPDNITNQITFGSDGAALAAFQRMLQDMRMKGEPLGSIDFDKLLPMPKELDMEASGRTDQGLELVQKYHQALADLERRKPSLPHADYEQKLHRCKGLYRKKRVADLMTWALGERAYNNIQRFGSPTWYEWCRLNWGSKWNAYEFKPLDETADTMEFQTADSAVPKIAAALSNRFPTETVTYSWSGGEPVQHLGQMVFRDGKAVQIDIPDDRTAQAYAMSAGVWRFGAKEELAQENGPRQKKPKLPRRQCR